MTEDTNADIFNNCLNCTKKTALLFSTGIFPDLWKLACITPIHKSGNNKLVINYKPVSLLWLENYGKTNTYKTLSFF